MTITDESTSRVGDSSAPPAASSSPSFFQRICCCCNSDLKEPPVQLIRSGSLTYQQGRAVAEESSAVPPASSSNNVISAANNSIEDAPAPGPRPQTSQKPKDADAESVNMNDLLMENVLKTTEEDRTEAVEEDIVSISTNVVQEVDENDLKGALRQAGNDSNELPAPKLKGRSAISKELQSASESSEDEGEEDNRKMSVIEFIRSEAQAETSATLASPLPLSPMELKESKETTENKYLNEKMSEATQSEISDSEDDGSTDTGKQIHEVGMSSKTTARAEKTSDTDEQRIREFKELSSDESLKGSSEDEEDVPPPLPSSPPPRLAEQNSFSQPETSPIPPPRSPQKSRMYADADSDDSEGEDSDDEASGEAHPVNALVRMHPVNFAPHKEEDQLSVSSVSSVASTASDMSEKENEEEDTIGVTRISVKSDGRAEIHSPKSPVRVTLEPDRNEVTDDDFSEKLI